MKTLKSKKTPIILVLKVFRLREEKNWERLNHKHLAKQVEYQVCRRQTYQH